MKGLEWFWFLRSSHDLFKLSHVRILTRDQLGHVMTATRYSEAVVVHGRLDNNWTKAALFFVLSWRSLIVIYLYYRWFSLCCRIRMVTYGSANPKKRMSTFFAAPYITIQIRPTTYLKTTYSMPRSTIPITATTLTTRRKWVVGEWWFRSWTIP